MIAFTFKMPHGGAAALAGVLLLFLWNGRCPPRRTEGAVDGMFVTVPNPITDAGIWRIRNSINRALNQPGRPIKKVVFDFNPLDENKTSSEAATTNYGSCLDLAALHRRSQKQRRQNDRLCSRENDAAYDAARVGVQRIGDVVRR